MNIPPFTSYDPNNVPKHLFQKQNPLNEEKDRKIDDLPMDKKPFGNLGDSGNNLPKYVTQNISRNLFEDTESESEIDEKNNESDDDLKKTIETPGFWPPIPFGD